ncbi:MAG: creatininase family protein [Alphaproteobacteria bacterium]|nr:creatininase family protein [Alphaproteobacteria bacterium]
MKWIHFVVWAVAAVASGIGPAVAEAPRLAEIATALPNTVFVAEMTWLEVAGALRRGKRAVIIPTGGLEQGGPHLVTGKHNYIVRHTAEALARGLGDALVAPVVVYVPEGAIEPPRGHMAFPGTVSLPEPVFRAVLENIARSFKAHGFTEILLLGDSGGNQAGQRQVSDSLNREWANTRARVLHVSDYYDAEANGQFAHLRRHGKGEAAKGGHADMRDTSELLAAFPQGVRPDMIGKAGVNGGATGVMGDATGASAKLGQTMLELKLTAALAQVRRWRARQQKN